MRKIVSGLLILLLFNCEKKDITPPNNNSVSLETISSELLDNGGVILKGKIENVQLPINYGFVLSNHEGGTFEYANISKFLNGNFNGDYSVDFYEGLHKNHTYYYNAVAFTSNRYVFGEEKSFVSNGSAIPIITEVQPTKAHIFDTISIKGKHFSKDPRVYFKESTSDIIFKSDTLIRCIVPYFQYQDELGKIPSPQITIEKSTQEKVRFDGFSLYTPEVHSLEPYYVHDSDTVTIYGDHFHKDAFRNRLTLESYGNHHTLQIVESSRTKIKFVVGAYTDFHPKFRLTSQLQTINIEDKLEVKLPTITGVSECVSFGEDFIVRGDNFPSFALNGILWVKIGGASLVPHELYKDSLVVKMYDAGLDKFNYDELTVTCFDHDIKFKTDICIDEPWITVGNDDLYLIHSYQGETYGIIYEGYQQPPTIGKFDPVSNKFSSITGEFIPEEVRYGLKVFNKDKLYHYSSSPNNPNAFKSYNIFTKQLKDLAPFPGILRNNGLIQSVGDYVYLGLGGNISLDYFTDIWRYSIQEDKWEHVADFTAIDSNEKAKVKPLSFVIGDKIYIAAGERNYSSSDFWVLNTSTNSINSREPLPSPIASTWIYSNIYATSRLNKGYYFNQYLEEYNSDTNTWKTYYDIPGGSPENRIFFHDGNLYKASGNISKLNPLYFK